MADVKHCPKCGQTKPLAEFSRNRRAPDGLQAWCRQCMRDAALVRYYDRNRGQTRRRPWQELGFRLFGKKVD